MIFEISFWLLEREKKFNWSKQSFLDIFHFRLKHPQIPKVVQKTVKIIKLPYYSYYLNIVYCVNNNKDRFLKTLKIKVLTINYIYIVKVKYIYFHKLGPLRRVGLVVAMSACVFFVCPLPWQFFCVVGLVQSVPRPWTGAISISISILSRPLKTRYVPEFNLDLDLDLE